MKRPTIKDVAADCAVSTATVSLVLRESPQIGVATKARVRESMARLGYVYNRRAADMRSQNSRTLGLVVTNIRNPYFAELTMAIEQAAHDRGYTLLLGCSSDEVDRQRQLLETMTERRIDGLIMLPASETTPGDLTGTLVAAGVPHVLVTRAIRGYDSDYVGANNLRSGRVIGQHLGDIGVGSVAFLGGVRNSLPREDRLRGVRQGLKPAGLRVSVDLSSAGDGRANGPELVQQLLRRGPCPDAIVAYNDMYAFGVLNALRANGIDPGGNVAVASFDNVPDASHQVPGVTSADGFPARVGTEAARLFLERLEDRDRPFKRVLIEPDLVVRDSTKDWSAPRVRAG